MNTLLLTPRHTLLLTSRRIPVERKASAAKREVDQDIVAREESVFEVDSAEREWSGRINSINSRAREPQALQKGRVIR